MKYLLDSHILIWALFADEIRRPITIHLIGYLLLRRRLRV